MVTSCWGSLVGERVGEMVMVFLLGKLVSWLLTTGGEGGLHSFSLLGERSGCMVIPRWGRGLSVCKVNSCFACCCVRFSVANFVCPVVVVFNFIFYYVFQFVLVACFLLSVFLSLFGHFVNFLTLKSVSPDFVLILEKFIHSVSVGLKI